ncbi:MAG: YdcF family protein [Pseudomonadota bacterium]
MEFLAVKTLAAFVEPPGVFVALLALATLLIRRRPAIARALCVLCIGGLLVLSNSIVASMLLDSLNRYPPATPAALRDAQAIVILGGGAQRNLVDYGGGTVKALALERLRHGALLAKQTGLPVLVTDGGPDDDVPAATYMAQALTEWGVRPRWSETRARTTYDNARYSRDVLAAEGISRVALVSHGWHLPRAVTIFEHAGLQVVPAPTLVPIPNKTGADLTGWLPDGLAFARSMLAVHEIVGGAWYRLRYGSGA